MRKTILISILAVLGMATAATASVTVGGQAFQLMDPSGSAVPNGSLWALILDADNDAFAGWDFTGDATDNTSDVLDSLLFDTDDYVIAKGGTTDHPLAPVPGYADMGSHILDLGGPEGADTGDGVYLFWFPGLADTATSAGEEQPFGVLHVTEVPSEGGTLAPALTNGSYNADYVTTPEPATMALLAIGGGLMALRRRRHA